MSDTGLKAQLRADLTTAMKARDEIGKATLRMVLAAITEAEVAGESAAVLTDAQVQDVLAKQARKRADAAEAFDSAGRAELADRERAEQEFINRYLPQPLTDAELAELVDSVLATFPDATMKQMGQVVKAVQAEAGSRAEGGKIAGLVRARLA